MLRTIETIAGPHRIAAPARISTMPIAIALLNGNPPPPIRGTRGAFFLSAFLSGRGRGLGCCGGGAQRAASSADSS